MGSDVARGRAGSPVAATLLSTALLSTALLAACAGCAGTSSDQTSDAPPPSFTVEYAPDLNESVYLPDAKGRVPLVVMVPGGGWATADPAGLAGLAAALAEAGVAAAPTQIRAAEDDVVYPAPVEDVLCAVSAAVAAIGSRGYVADPVAVLGHSSGAHLAALAVLAVDDYTPSCQEDRVRPGVLIGLSGPYDVSRVPDVAGALLGTSPAEDPETWAAANPVERADLRPDVPVLLLHGDADETVPVSFTTDFADALEAGGHPTTLEVVPGADHEAIYQADVAGDRIARWLLDGEPASSATKSHPSGR